MAKTRARSRACSGLGDLDENKVDQVYQRKFKIELGEMVHVVTYKEKPLGVDVESGQDGTNLYVTANNNPNVNVKKGMLLAQINEHVVRALPAPQIVEKINICELPIQIWYITVDSRKTFQRGLSLRIRRSIAVSPGLIRIYLPNGTPYNVEASKYDLKTLLDMVCKAHGLVADEMVLVMQNREKENDVQHPSLEDSALEWIRKFARHYRLRLLTRELAGRYKDGVPVDGISIMTKNGFSDETIQDLRKLMNKMLNLPVDVAVATMSNTIEDEYSDLKLTEEEVKAIVIWHKNIVKQEDIITKSPEQHFIRIYFEGDGLQHKTFSLKYPMIKAEELCNIVSEDQKISCPENFALHIKGTAVGDVRSFEQELRPDDMPNQVKQAILDSGGYGRLQFVYKEKEQESDDEESSESEDIDLAPTARAFRVGSIDGWSDQDLAQLQKAMEEHMNEMRLQEAEAAENVKVADEKNDNLEEQLKMEERRLDLLKECVLNQYQLSEVIHDFDASSIQDFPAHKKLQDLRVGEVMIVTETDISGWARGKNIAGGDEAYFPASYVEVVAQPEMLVEVIHDFDPNGVKNLPEALVVIELTRGELILVTGTHVSGWWRGCKVKGGPEGYFPGDYTKCVTAPTIDMTFRTIYGDAVIEGYLKLREGVLKRFQNKYVYLTNEELLYFNTEGSDPHSPTGRINLKQQDVKLSSVKKEKCKFTISVGRKAYEWKIDKCEVDDWIEKLTDLCNQ